MTVTSLVDAGELDHEAHLGIAATAEVDDVRHWREEVGRRLHLAAHGRQPFDDEAPRRVGSRLANALAARRADGRAGERSTERILDQA